ncbi:hypothetical protein CLOP_g14571, partial [Closterium sp. NIES-67]
LRAPVHRALCAPVHHGSRTRPPGDPPTFAPDVNDPQSSETAIRTYRAGLTDHVRQQLLFEASRAEHDAATAAYNTYEMALADDEWFARGNTGTPPRWSSLSPRPTPQEVRTSPLFQPVSSPLAHQAVS